MSLAAVRISEEVWLTCAAHALTTETEEIMGLLLGDIQSLNGIATALIWGASPQMRSDRRKDRVETNPEQLAAAAAQAERMTLTTGRITRVIGWYHSHPHITVLPSHVDVRTQAMYQMLDPGFIGLIFSCFGEDAQKVGRIQVIAFQSLDGRERQMSTVNSSSVIDVDTSWTSSDNVLSTSASALTENFEQDTGDSGLTKGKQRMKGQSLVPYNADSLHITTPDLDSSDMTASMQEALHRSTMDVSGLQYVRKEVPLQVLPTKDLLNIDSPLASFTDMQNVLFEEERSAFKNAIVQNIHDGKIHPLTYIHHASTYQASLCKLLEYCLSPAVNTLQDRLKENEIRLTMLTEEAKSLEKGIRESDSRLESPRRSPSHVFRGNNMVTGQLNIQASADSEYVRSPRNVGSRRKAT